MNFIKDNLVAVKAVAIIMTLSSSLVGCQSELLETDTQEMAELIIDLKTDAKVRPISLLT